MEGVAEMKLSDAIIFALKGFQANPTRAGAACSVIGAGVSAITLVSCIFLGFSALIEDLTYGNYGRSVVITPSISSFASGATPLNLNDREIIEKNLFLGHQTTAWRSESVQLLHGINFHETRAYGVAGDYQAFTEFSLLEGRSLDIREGSIQRECLLGNIAAAKLAEEGSSRPLSTIRVNGIPCEVVGILKPSRKRSNERYDDSVLMSFDSLVRLYGTSDYMDAIAVTELIVTFSEAQDLENQKIELDLVLRKSRGVPLSQLSPFSFAEGNFSVRFLKRQRALLGNIMLLLSSVCLVASLVGFAAMMRSYVTDRQREIALFLTSGAKPDDIFTIFMIEAATLGVLGGSLGAVAGIGLAFGVSLLWAWPFSVAPSVLLLSLLFGLLVGIGSGFLPAWRAAKSDPIDFIRT